MEKKKIPKNGSREISRREFLKDAGLVVGGAAIGSTVLLAACGPAEVTKTVEVPVEVPRVKLVLHHDPLLCGGCSTCQDVCEFVHDGAAGLRVIQHPLQGYVTELETCQQCPTPWCMEACLFDAISIDPDTGARVIDAEKCTGCGQCTEACPWHMPALVPSKNVYFKCDLCGGDPKCVKYCPWGALTLVKVEEE